MTQQYLSLKAVTCHRGAALVLEDVCLEVPKGARILVKGENGAGKSTLLQLIAGILRPDRGLIMFRGSDIVTLPAHGRSRLGIVFLPQGGYRFSNLKTQECFDVVSRVATKHARYDGSLWKERALRSFPILQSVLMKRLGLLSAGEKALVDLTLAILCAPSLLLLDEPLANLSVDNSGALLQFLFDLATEECCSVVMVEHRDTGGWSTDRLVVRNGAVVPLSALGDTKEILDEP